MNAPSTPAADLKGGDWIELGGRAREVFDTYPLAYGATMLRFLDDAGEVRNVRMYANDRVVRIETLTAIKAKERAR